MKKKIIASLLCLTMVFSMTACGGKNSDSDVDYIKDKGTLVVGITDFEPMDIKMIQETGSVSMRIWQRWLLNLLE